MNHYIPRLRAFLLALFLLLALAACGGSDTKATTMRLLRTEGTVAVADGDGEDVPLLENLGLYSGYGVDTRSESYAWINLDDVKLTKMDQESEIAIKKEEKALEIEVKSGSLFFNVIEPLADDETMDIRTSTMLVGIRGTCGWVEYRDGISRVYILEGTVECTAGNQTVQVSAGEMAELTVDGKLTVTAFTTRAIAAFVMDEIVGDNDLMQAIATFVMDEIEGDNDLMQAIPEPDPVTDVLDQYRAIISRADTYEYGEPIDGANISYQYALVQMQQGDTVPTLLIEQLVEDSFYGSFGYARVFQYVPESGDVYQPSDILMEGVAGAGGYRGSLAMMGDGDGIQAMEWFSGTGDTTISRVTMEGDSLLWTTAWEGRIDQMPDDMRASVGIDWHDISDTSALDSWTPDENISAAQRESTQPSEPGTLPADGDRIVFTGTINRYTYDEVLVLQEVSDPNPFPDNVERDFIFQLIVLDTPQTMELINGDGDGSRSGTVSIISVHDDEGIEQYDGQHLIFSIDPSRTWWPSGASLPLGEPGTDDIHILGPA